MYLNSVFVFTRQLHSDSNKPSLSTKSVSNNYHTPLSAAYKHPVSEMWIGSNNTSISPSELVMPIFVSDKEDEYSEIPGFPEQYR